MASQGSSKGSSDRSRRTGKMPGASRHGSFIIYTGAPETLADTILRMWKKLAIVGVFVAVVAIAIAFFKMGTANDAGTNFVTEDALAEPGATERYEPPQTAVDFLTASTLEAKLRTVRHRDQMAGSIKDFYKHSADTRDRYSGISPVIETGGDPEIERCYVNLGGDQRVVAVINTHSGPKVDWPAFARINEVDWNSFLSGSDSVPKAFRVHISDFEYYAGDFADMQKFKCFKISSPDLAKNLIGYAPRGSATELALSLYSAPVERRCMLKLVPPSNADSQQVVIDGYVTPGWVEPE